MKSVLRLIGLLLCILSLGSTVFAQGEPPDITLPGDGTPPDVEIPGLPPTLLPPNWGLIIDPASAGTSSLVTLMYLPTAGTTGSFAFSDDMENWTLAGTPTLQSGTPVEYELDVAADETLFVRWVVSEP